MTEIVYIHLELDRLMRLYIMYFFCINRFIISYTTYIHRQVATIGKPCVIIRFCPATIAKDTCSILRRSDHIFPITNKSHLIGLTCICIIYICVTLIHALPKIFLYQDNRARICSLLIEHPHGLGTCCGDSREHYIGYCTIIECSRRRGCR